MAKKQTRTAGAILDGEKKRMIHPHFDWFGLYVMASALWMEYGDSRAFAPGLAVCCNSSTPSAFILSAAAVNSEASMGVAQTSIPESSILIRLNFQHRGLRVVSPAEATSKALSAVWLEAAVNPSPFHPHSGLSLMIRAA